jgi:hypothetical protein
LSKTTTMEVSVELRSLLHLPAHEPAGVALHRWYANASHKHRKTGRVRRSLWATLAAEAN